jgi:hypothetical protein
MGKKTMVLRVKVVQQETVHVPTGAFAFCRIEAESEEDHSGIYPVKVWCTFWYSAEMKRTINMTIDAKVLGGNKGSGETYELASSDPGK